MVGLGRYWSGRNLLKSITWTRWCIYYNMKTFSGLWLSVASLQYAQNTSSNIISLAEHLGTRISDHVPETPNRLSEEMIKCMSALYCKLADPPLTHNGLSSPNSSISSMSAFSPRDQCDMWSPGFRNNSSFDVRLDNPFHVEGLKEFSGPYSTMVEVPWIYRDGQKLGDTEHLLQNFRWTLMTCLTNKISYCNGENSFGRERTPILQLKSILCCKFSLSLLGCSVTGHLSLN